MFGNDLRLLSSLQREPVNYEESHFIFVSALAQIYCYHLLCACVRACVRAFVRACVCVCKQSGRILPKDACSQARNTNKMADTNLVFRVSEDNSEIELSRG